MISFRQHVVSLLAVFLALAVGIVLGGGPLSTVGAGVADPGAGEADAQPQLDAATRDRALFGDEVAQAVAADAYGGALRGVPVALLAMPGSDAGSADDLAAQVEAAGGRVSGRWRAEPSLVSAGETALVDTLGSQLAAQQAERGSALVTEGASTYDRMGQLVARAIASTEPKGEQIGSRAATVAESLRAGELLTAEAEPTARAPFVVVLLGEDGDVAEDPIFSGLLAGMARHSVGVLVAAGAQDGANGRISRLRTEPVAEEVVTVDGVEHPAGAVTAVLALTRWPDTRGGRYGASGDDGAVPLG